MDYKNNQPFIKNGLEASQISFSGGRLAASIGKHGGITHINYYGNQRFGDVIFYKADPISAWAFLYRPAVQINGKMYILEFNNTSIFPFGYSSSCSFEGIEFGHGLYLLNDAMVFRLNVTVNPDRREVTFMLINTVTCTQVDKPTRTWSEIEVSDDATSAFCSVVDSYSPETVKQETEEAQHTLAQAGSYYSPPVAESKIWIGVTANSNIEFRKNPSIEGLHKHYFSSECQSDENYFCLLFSHEDKERFNKRAIELQETAADEISELVNQYNAKISQPDIVIENKTVQSLLMNTGPFLNSLKVPDIPGGMRAADSGYWIWGWDTMVHSEAFGFANDSDYLREILEFYKKTADPEWGIFHEMLIDQRPCLSMAFSAQCLYAITLYHAYVFTGDKKLLHEYFPFAKWILDKAAEAEVGQSGLIEGVALYPDHPEDLEQDGNDLSSFNNSIYYQALKAMVELADEAGDHETAANFQTRAERTCSGFQHFYDSEKHYFYDSISSVDFCPREHYPVYAILWLTPYAKDLIGGNVNSIARFMGENFPARLGLRLLPTWDTRFMYDGSQLGMYMPVVENFHREIMNAAGDVTSIDALFESMQWFWEQLCIPEALTCEYENHGMTPDNPGRKQAFCAKAWLAAFYHIAAGINISTKGISFTACNTFNTSIKNLKVRDSCIDIAITGEGGMISELSLNQELKIGRSS